MCGKDRGPRVAAQGYYPEQSYSQEGYTNPGQQYPRALRV